MERIIPLAIHEETYQWLKKHLNTGMLRTTPEEMIRDQVANYLKLMMQNAPDSPYSQALQSAQPYSQVNLVPESPKTGAAE